MSLAAVIEPIAHTPTIRAPSLETIGMTKIFGSLIALEDVSIKVEPGTVHALLGENGAWCINISR
jgi:simple sugar transport system ATP-binding protein